MSRRDLLTQYRQSAYLTQQQLADLLEVHRQTVIRWEAGETEPRSWQRPKLAAVLSVKPEDIERAIQPGNNLTSTLKDPASSVEFEVPTAEGTPPPENDDLDRRTFIAASASAVASTHDVLSRVAAGLFGLSSNVEIDERRLSIGVLHGEVEDAERAWIAGRAEHLRTVLPNLTERLRAALAASQGAEQDRLHALNAYAHRNLAGLMQRMERPDLALVAAGKALDSAHLSGQPVVVANAARTVTGALSGAGTTDAARELATAIAQDYAHDLVSSEDGIAAFGSLLLFAAGVEASAAAPAATRDLLDEAEDTAGRLDAYHMGLFVEFGQAKVDMYRMETELALGNPGLVIEVAQALNLNSLGPVHQATAAITMARASLMLGRPAEALTALLKASALAPGEFRVRPTVVRALTSVAEVGDTSTRAGALNLAARNGIAA